MVTSPDTVSMPTLNSGQPPVIPLQRIGREPGRHSTAATRHLSAAAYLDEVFCETSLEEVYHEDRRVVAPSLGFNLGAVLSHCLQAHKIRLMRDVLIVGMLSFSLVFLTAGFTIGLAVFLCLYAVHAGWRVLLAAATYTSREDARAAAVLSQGFRFILICIAAAIAITLAGVAASISTLLLAYFGADGGSIVALIVVGALLSFFAVLGVPALTDMLLWHMATKHAPGRPAVVLPSNTRISQIEQQQLGNTAVFSGFRPFVGSGVHLNTASFALRLVRVPGGGNGTREAEREYDWLPFHADDLIGHVRNHLEGLTVSPQPEGCLPNLKVRDRVYVAGNEVSTLTTDTDAENLVQVMRTPADARRHFLACEVSSWDGELITSVYLHLALQGKTLYLQTVTYGLAPCHDAYRIIDDARSVGAVPYFTRAVSAVMNSPRTIVSAPRNLMNRAWQSFARAKSSPQSQRLTHGFDYGARMSIREFGSPDRLRNAFQKQDIDKYWHIIQRRAHAAVLDFLEAHGVDISELRQRFEQVINNGIYVRGNAGDFNLSGNFNSPGATSAAPSASPSAQAPARAA
jgi:hypothetical protein